MVSKAGAFSLDVLGNTGMREALEGTEDRGCGLEGDWESRRAVDGPLIERGTIEGRTWTFPLLTPFPLELLTPEALVGPDEDKTGSCRDTVVEFAPGKWCLADFGTFSLVLEATGTFVCRAS